MFVRDVGNHCGVCRGILSLGLLYLEQIVDDNAIYAENNSIVSTNF